MSGGHGNPAELTSRALLELTFGLVGDLLGAPRWNGLRAALPDETAAPRRIPPRSLTATRWLNGIADHATPGTQDLCEVLTRNAAHLPWGQTYDEADFGAAFLERYGWMELIGQRGPYVSDKVACGFLLLGSDITYPRHRHAAEEIYIVLSGTADWLKADGVFEPQTPGTVIHHPPWCWHAMRTGEQALLALYLWRGGSLTQKSEIAAPD